MKFDIGELVLWRYIDACTDSDYEESLVEIVGYSNDMYKVCFHGEPTTECFDCEEFELHEL